MVFPSLRMAFPHLTSPRGRGMWGTPPPLGEVGRGQTLRSLIFNPQFSILNNYKFKNISKVKKKEIIKYGIQLLIAILTAIGTSLGVTSCMSML